MNSYSVQERPYLSRLTRAIFRSSARSLSATPTLVEQFNQLFMPPSHDLACASSPLPPDATVRSDVTFDHILGTPLCASTIGLPVPGVK